MINFDFNIVKDKKEEKTSKFSSLDFMFDFLCDELKKIFAKIFDIHGWQFEKNDSYVDVKANIPPAIFNSINADKIINSNPTIKGKILDYLRHVNFNTRIYIKDYDLDALSLITEFNKINSIYFLENLDIVFDDSIKSNEFIDILEKITSKNKICTFKGLTFIKNGERIPKIHSKKVVFAETGLGPNDKSSNFYKILALAKKDYELFELDSDKIEILVNDLAYVENENLLNAFFEVLKKIDDSIKNNKAKIMLSSFAMNASDMKRINDRLNSLNLKHKWTYGI